MRFNEFVGLCARAVRNYCVIWRLTRRSHGEGVRRRTAGLWRGGEV